MTRGGGKRRLVRRSRSSFRDIALVVALPALALAGFLIWSWVTNDERATPVDRATATSPIDASLTVPGTRTVDWHEVLDRSGVDPSSINERGGDLHVEYPGTASELLADLNAAGTRGRSVDDSTVELTSGTESIIVHVEPMAVHDSGLGLVAVGDQKPGTIVLILDDVGFERQPLERAAAIDPNIAFAVIPSATRARAASDWLGSRGFEILCHLPMEPDGWPGVRVDEPAILVGMSDDEIRSTTDTLLGNVPGAVGVNNHMGSRASSDRRVMREVMEVVRERGLYFVDSRTASSSVAAATARELGVRHASRHVFLDDDPSPQAVRRQLRELAERSRRDGLSVGIGHVVPGTVAVLEEEIPRLREAGIRIVRPSEIVR